MAKNIKPRRALLPYTMPPNRTIGSNGLASASVARSPLFMTEFLSESIVMINVGRYTSDWYFCQLAHPNQAIEYSA